MQFESEIEDVKKLTGSFLKIILTKQQHSVRVSIFSCISHTFYILPQDYDVLSILPMAKKIVLKTPICIPEHSYCKLLLYKKVYVYSIVKDFKLIKYLLLANHLYKYIYNENVTIDEDIDFGDTKCRLHCNTISPHMIFRNINIKRWHSYNDLCSVFESLILNSKNYEFNKLIIRFDPGYIYFSNKDKYEYLHELLGQLKAETFKLIISQQCCGETFHDPDDPDDPDDFEFDIIKLINLGNITDLYIDCDFCESIELLIDDNFVIRYIEVDYGVEDKHYELNENIKALVERNRKIYEEKRFKRVKAIM